MIELQISTPGRVCLFGEHQDYLNLPIIASAISLRISVRGHKTADRLVLLHLPDIGREEKFVLEPLLTYEHDRDYFKSSFNVLQKHGFTFSSGLECIVHGEIPINAGTSSSSALVVTWINFLSMMSDQNRRLSPEEIAQYAYEAEVLEFSEPGGMMDQYSTSLGGVIYLESYPEIRVRKVPVNLGSFVLGDSGEPKDTKTILARVKNRTLKVVKELQRSYPEFSLQTVSMQELDTYSRSLDNEQIELLRGTIRNRDITREALKVLEAYPTDHRLVGQLMNEHQEVLRDVLRISTPKIDKMINASLKAGAYGAKINGSGGGGCMFAYAPENPRKVKEAIEKSGGKAFIINVDEGTRVDKELD
ncbi:MAG: mevalonate kinase family protein [Candidatus Kryptoniota bacterium]